MATEIPFEAQEADIPHDARSAKEELLKLLEERAKRKRESKMQDFFTDDGPNARDNYRKHIAFFNAGRDYRERVIFGGNRCLGFRTEIETADGPRPILSLADGSATDVVSWDGERKCIAPASGWFLKGFEPMFRIVVDTGQSFDCTGGHRVCLASGSFHTIQDVVSRSSGHYCSQTVVDYLASCVVGDCRGGQQLRQATGTAPAPAPSRDGAPPHTRLVERAGVTEHIQQCTRALEVCGPHSTQGDLRQISDLFDLFAGVGANSASQSLRYVHRKVRQLHAESAPRLQSGAAVLRPKNDVWHTSEPFYPLDSPELLGGNKIIAVVPIGWQPVLDCTVEGTHCYESSGVIHHNTGKSVAGAYEAALHLTGQYPDWWAGKRFSRPVQGLACGKEAKITRDTVQQILLGKVDEFGTGLIPGNCLSRDKCTASRAASGLFDGIPVKHKSGGWSMLRLRSYDQGRTAFEGVERDFIWEDEEAPQDVHNENLMRTMTTGGIVFNTFTPLKGETPLVRDLLNRAKEGTVFSINVWWDDVGHISEEMINDMKNRYPKHEMRARRFGEPQLGSGAIFTADEDSYIIRPMSLPDYWPRLFGLDFGWVHPTAACWGAHDRETDVVYVYSEHCRSKAEVPIHVGAIKTRGDWIPGIAETAGTNQADGKRMIDLYKGHGLKLKRVVKGPGSIESGIMRLQERFSEGTLKIMETCPMLLAELRRYHRDANGAVVKQNDDLIDALRYMESGLKYAKTQVETRGDVSGGNVREINFWNRGAYG